jgi:Lrp/AsnC family leucine-responsive transcriptional regulator
MADAKILDDNNIKILKTLQKDARISFSALGRAIGLSSPAVAERVKKMEEAGYIKGYKAVVAPEKIGVKIIAIISLSATTSILKVLDNDVLMLPEIVEIYHLSGLDSVLIKVMADSIDHLKSILEGLNKYGETMTSIILSSPVAPRPIHIV